MKRYLCVLLAMCVLLLSGCGKPAEMDKMSTPWVVPPELLGQPIKDALKAGWDKWNAMSADEQLVSSSLPGWGDRYFDSWEECETFVGLTVPNPLETCGWLEKGTYVGMPIGFADAQRMWVTWEGDAKGTLRRVMLYAGYCSGDVRVTLTTTIYGEKDFQYNDTRWSTYLEYTDGIGAYIEEGDSWNPGRCTGTVAKGYVLYYVNVLGPNDMPEASRAMLDKVLELLETVEIE